MSSEAAKPPADHRQTWVVTRQVETRTRLGRIDDHLEALSTDECLTYLRQGGVGRIAFIAHGLPIVLPVNYVMREDEIVFLTSSGAKLHALESGSTLTFEIDHVGTDGVGWSVLAAGPTWSSTATALIEEIAALGAHPPRGPLPSHAIGLQIRAVTGRRFGSADQRRLHRGEP